ncbi:MAG: potassium channel family protein [Halioglobus sp.]
MNQLTFIFVATAMTLLCLSLQAGFGVYAVQFSRRFVARTDAARPALWRFWGIALMLLILTLGNFLQIIVWALLYLYLGEFDHFNDAFYFSGVTFTSLGYGDVTLSLAHRGLSPVEAANGLMMFGVSTAILFAVIQNHRPGDHPGL